MKTPITLRLLGLLLLVVQSVPATLAVPSEYWLSPGGSDAARGAYDSPLATPLAAIQKYEEALSRKKNRSASALKIIFQSGTYRLKHAIHFCETDFPNRITNITFEAAPGAHPVLSGGVQISNWQRPAIKIVGLPQISQSHIWVAKAPQKAGKPVNFRQLWVNGHKAIRARSPNKGKLLRLVRWNKAQQTATIPALALAGLTNPKGLEMVIDQVWEIAILRVKSITFQHTNALVTFRQPESKIEFEHPWPPVVVNKHYQAPFYLVNAIQLLDAPGEWYENLSSGKVYYWPRAGEKMNTASVVAPILKTLVKINGEPKHPVTHLTFKGLTFSHTTWLRPSQAGHVPLQAGMFMLKAKKLKPVGTPYHHGLDNVAWIGRPPAAVSVEDANYITFEHCTFEHLASAGLDLMSGTHHDLIQGCVFRDIGGNGLQLGKFSDTNVETHTPWNPEDKQKVCSDETIANNLFFNCANEDWGCVGICAGYVRHVTIEHNNVHALPYTGISVGWGWSKTTNAMANNLVQANRVYRIGQRLGDLGGIYTLSAQPGTVIADNAIYDIHPSRYVPDPTHWFYLYLDEGSSFITVRDNWCPRKKFLKNANGPGNVWKNNGPQVSQKIKDAAGLEPAFQHLTSQN